MRGRQAETQTNVMKTSSHSTHLARNLRRNYIDAELTIWQRIKNRQMNGIKFRRQQPIGHYIVDFVSYNAMLIVEIDGGQHNEETDKIYDAKRTAYLKTLGYTVLRFWNNDVLTNIDGVLEKIRISTPHSTSYPCQAGGLLTSAPSGERTY